MSNEIDIDFSPMIKVYKDGRVERLKGTDKVPPSTDPQTGVQSKDVVISTDKSWPPISARLYIPSSTATTTAKLPLLVYFHGGGFCSESASSPTYHNYLNSLVSKANVVAVSVDYRLAPEQSLPGAYDDSWTALKWVASHFDGKGPEEWINKFADFGRVFFGGDSAGANLAHQMGLKVSSEGLVGVKLVGILLVHPYFWGIEPVGHEVDLSPFIKEFIARLWRFTYPLTSGSDDPLINPGKDPKLGELGCERLLVFVAGKDTLRYRGYYYCEMLRKSGWKGTMEIFEDKEEEHCFHLDNPTCESAVALEKKVVSFLNEST